MFRTVFRKINDLIWTVVLLHAFLRASQGLAWMVLDTTAWVFDMVKKITKRSSTKK